MSDFELGPSLSHCPNIALSLHLSHITAKIYMLRNYEMKDEINCFVVFKIDKYGINYIVTARNSAYRGTPFVPNETFNFNYYRSGRNVLLGPGQCISFWMKVDILSGTKCFYERQNFVRL